MNDKSGIHYKLSTIASDLTTRFMSALNLDLDAPRELHINGCEKIILNKKDIELQVELLGDKIDRFDAIIINGIKFIKEKQ